MKKEESLQSILEEAAVAAAKELRTFLKEGTKDEKASQRVQIALSTVTSYTRWRSSQNNLASMMLSAARQAGLDNDATRQIAEETGLLPETTNRLKLAAKNG